MNKIDNDPGKARAEKALRQSEERLRMFIAASSNMVYRMNADWTRMENLVGKELLADTPEPIAGWIDKYILPEDQPQVLSAIQQAIATKSIFELEHRVIRADGSVGWVHSRAVPLFNGQEEITEWFGAGTDITQRKKAEAALQVSEEKYRMLFNSIDEGFCIIEVLIDENNEPYNYRFLEANQAFERQTGFVDAIGKTVKELAPAHEQYWFDIYGRIAKTGKPERFENAAAAMNRYYEVYAFSTGEPQEHRVAVLFNDITERKRTDEHQAYLLKLSDALRPLADPVEIQSVAAGLLGEHLQANQVHNSEVTGEYIPISHGYGDKLPPVTGKVHHHDFGGRLVEGYRTGQARVCYNTTTDPTICETERAVLASAHIGAFIAVPLMKGGERVATLAVHNIEPRNWKQSEIDVVQETAARTWAAVERARTEKALAESKERLHLSIKTANLFTWDVDPETGEINHSSNATEALGFDIGKTSQDNFAYIHPDDRELVVPAVKQALQGKTPLDIEHRIVNPESGKEIWVRAQGQLTRIDSNKYSFIGITQNITQRKLLEQQKEEFISVASHELKTPVTSIKAYGEVLQDMLDEAGDPVNAELMKKVNIQIDRLAGLIDDLLDTTKISEGQLMLNKERFNLNDLIRQRVEDQQHISPGHSIVLSLCQDAFIQADRERIGQVLTNLISNAIKYSPKGGEVRVSCQTRQEGVLVSVQDEGVGISKEMQQRVFERFFRVPDIRVRNYPGMGLGLYITAGIIHRHDGKIWVESEPGEGSVFYFTLPF